MNKEFWDTLPTDYQNSIMEAMKEVTLWLREHTKSINEEMLERIEKSGQIEIHYQTEDEKNSWKQAFKPIYEKYSSVIGEELMKEIQRLQNNH